MLGSVRFVTQTDYWYAPDSVLLVLLPTSDVGSSGYWVDFYGALTQEYQQKLAEVLARWRHRWDARLVASWGTMLQFQVGRRPAPGDEAWTAAGQLKALAPSLDLSRWEVAVALPAGDARGSCTTGPDRLDRGLTRLNESGRRIDQVWAAAACTARRDVLGRRPGIQRASRASDLPMESSNSSANRRQAHDGGGPVASAADENA